MPFICLQSQLELVESRIRDITAKARTRLQGLLQSAQSLSLSRYELIDTLGRLERELLGGEIDSKDAVHGETERPKAEQDWLGGDDLSVLRRLEAVHSKMEVLARSLKWIAVLEQVAVLRYVSNCPRNGEKRQLKFRCLPVKKHYSRC